MTKFSVLFLLLGTLISSSVFADTELRLLRKMAVFPVADANYSTSEDAWWQMREVLTKEQRFLVASRRFMVNRGVFQARKNLKPADVIILGKILDAEAIMTSALIDRHLRLSVFESEAGGVLFEAELELHPAIPIADQLIRATQKLVQDFLISLPAQGFHLQDDAVGKPVYEIDGTQRALIFQGLHSGLEVGDPVQWIRASGDAGAPLLGPGLRVQVLAEGKVLSIKGNQAEVQIEKLRDLKELVPGTLVRFPRELGRLKSIYADDKSSALTSEYLGSEMRPVDELKGGHNPTSTALAVIGNIAMLVLLGF